MQDVLNFICLLCVFLPNIWITMGDFDNVRVFIGFVLEYKLTLY